MMAHFPVGGLDQLQVKSENELPLETAWSDEHECLPLKQRLKILRSKSVSNCPEETLISAVSPIDDVVMEEDDLCDSQVFHFDHGGSKGRSKIASCEQSQHGAVHAIECSPLRDRMLPERLEIEYNDAQYDSVTQLPNCQHIPSAHDIEISEDFLEDLDDIVLKERQRMLLSRELVGSIEQAMEHNLSDTSINSVDMISQDAGIGSGGNSICDIGGNDTFEKSDGSIYASCEALESRSSNCTTVGAPARRYQHQGTRVSESQKYKHVYGEARPYFSDRNAINEQCLLSSSCKTVCTLALPPFPNVKVEQLDDELKISDKDTLNSQSLGNKISENSQHVNTAEIFEDIIDHMMLGDRMRLLASRKIPKTTLYENFGNSSTFESSSIGHKPILSESSIPLMKKRPHKRRKTVTDSVETALEEDAPGLLQVLIEKGVLVDEIKLYGETEGDEVVDETLIEESFSELEDVIAKIFSQRQSFFKLAPIRCAKGEKASYCLACLISLVEQARYLRVRKWPVEWGWCRDLQSFIFVFERQNRIVLERPEYGYATYFFELVDTLPVRWQIKRLVTAMKLTSCSRITLIENRALTVGDDMTEGEARVLMEYGWIPNSGLGTMLNYCDRVVHDRKHESDTSEWRSKIGKLLTDGYNGGTIVPNDIPKKVMESGISHTSQVKLEQ
ncbi:uncharacterized protein LOC112513538 isoform X1 [Cynara cardunculus var. scolymus]|uniref:uncharacterized protein LOC112513538 isoform X1 n=1 Tax=Cynara cardunculus var. scolymus TaxID=59895 RepID=UPI000D62A99C|nr:uncharacterized protein LOC112513538 isoform X1 [Cynara cardunculus var. scolymus]